MQCLVEIRIKNPPLLTSSGISQVGKRLAFVTKMLNVSQHESGGYLGGRSERKTLGKSFNLLWQREQLILRRIRPLLQN